MHEDQNPRWHVEWWAKGLSVRFYCKWERLSSREEKAFCTFSQQLNNPHALRIDGLPRGTERGWDGEKGRKRGIAWVFGSKGACCAWWYCGTCVCMHGECGELPWPWPGAPLSKVFVVELTRGGSFLVGTRLPGQPRERQHEQGLLNLAFLTATLRAKEDPHLVRNIYKGDAITTERSAESVLNARWKPWCILVAYTPSLEWSVRCVCV